MASIVSWMSWVHVENPPPPHPPPHPTPHPHPPHPHTALMLKLVQYQVVFKIQSAKLSVLMPWISKHKHKIVHVEKFLKKLPVLQSCPLRADIQAVIWNTAVPWLLIPWLLPSTGQQTVMVLNIQDKQVLIFYEEGFNLPVPSQCRERIGSAFIYFFVSDMNSIPDNECIYILFVSEITWSPACTVSMVAAATNRGGDPATPASVVGGAATTTETRRRRWGEFVQCHVLSGAQSLSGSYGACRPLCCWSFFPGLGVTKPISYVSLFF